MTCYLGEGELVCEHCWQGEVEEFNHVLGGESDSPEHCAYCRRPLNDDFDLTEDGVRYVVQRVEDKLRNGIEHPEYRWEHGYYKGLGCDAVLLDWIELWIEPVKHRLPKREQRMIDLFVQWRGPRELQIAREAGNEVLCNTIIGH